jgi:membrane protease YdiL (CAAX protease family)
MITALTFGLFHLVNLLFGGDPVFVLRQVIFGCGAGIFYAGMVIRTNSLLPAMIFHYLVNIFMGSAGKYFLTYATPVEGTIFWTINVCIMVPVLTVYVRIFSSRMLGIIDEDG